MTTIDAIETRPFRLAMRGALQWGAYSKMESAEHVLVRVILSNGAQGVAEAPPRPTIYGETVTSVQSIIAEEIAPRLVGKSADIAFALLDQVKNNHTAKGAVDMALHVALAQTAETDLLSYLQQKWDPFQVQPMPSAIKVSYILGIGDDETVWQEVADVYAQGVRVFKVKIGRDWSADLRRLQAIQQEWPDLALYVDANECFSAENANLRLAELAEMGILYAEEPLPVELIRERADLRSGKHLPIIGDDSCFTPRDLARELSLDTFDILNIKTARTGFTASLKMATMARRASKTLMLGSQAGSLLGTKMAGLLATALRAEHPCELSFFLKLREDIIPHTLQIKEGWLASADLLALPDPRISLSS